MNNLLNTLLDYHLSNNKEVYKQLLDDIVIFGNCKYTIDYDESSDRIVINRIDPRSKHETYKQHNNR